MKVPFAFWKKIEQVVFVDDKSSTCICPHLFLMHSSFSEERLVVISRVPEIVANVICKMYGDRVYGDKERIQRLVRQYSIRYIIRNFVDQPSDVSDDDIRRQTYSIRRQVINILKEEFLEMSKISTSFEKIKRSIKNLF